MGVDTPHPFPLFGANFKDDFFDTLGTKGISPCRVRWWTRPSPPSHLPPTRFSFTALILHCHLVMRFSPDFHRPLVLCALIGGVGALPVAECLPHPLTCGSPHPSFPMHFCRDTASPATHHSAPLPGWDRALWPLDLPVHTTTFYNCALPPPGPECSPPSDTSSVGHAAAVGVWPLTLSHFFVTQPRPLAALKITLWKLTARLSGGGWPPSCLSACIVGASQSRVRSSRRKQTNTIQPPSHISLEGVQNLTIFPSSPPR